MMKVRSSYKYFVLTFIKIGFIFPSCRDLNSNDIEEIEEDSMANLSQLHDLHMQKNKIARIDSHTFRGLSNLRVL